MYVLRFKIKAKIITFNGWMGILVKQEVEVLPFEIKKNNILKNAYVQMFYTSCIQKVKFDPSRKKEKKTNISFDMHYQSGQTKRKWT